MITLSTNDWMLSPSIQLFPQITSDDSDHYYHNHNFYEIFYILDGHITHNYNGTKELLEPGDARLLRPQDQHGFIRKKGVACAHRDIIITEQLFKKCCAFVDPSLWDVINAKKAPLKAKIPQTKIVEFEKEFSKMFFAPLEKGTYNKEAMGNILSAKLLDLFLQEQSGK